jgi:hypothetical protein
LRAAPGATCARLLEKIPTDSGEPCGGRAARWTEGGFTGEAAPGRRRHVRRLGGIVGGVALGHDARGSRRGDRSTSARRARWARLSRRTVA